MVELVKQMHLQKEMLELDENRLANAMAGLPKRSSAGNTSSSRGRSMVPAGSSWRCCLELTIVKERMCNVS